MGTLFALFDLPWPQLLELGLLVWLGSIALMFVAFYVGMLALHALYAIDDWSDFSLGRNVVTAIPDFLLELIVFIVAAYDWLINHTSAALLFWDKAQEPMVTGRLERYKRGTGWRKRFADVICTKCLDWADPSGVHCN